MAERANARVRTGPARRAFSFYLMDALSLQTPRETRTFGIRTEKHDLLLFSAEWRHMSEVYGPIIAKWVERAGDNICDPSSADSIAFDREHDEFIVARAMKIIEHEFEPNTWTAFRMQIVERQRPADVASHLGLSTNAVVKSKSRVLKRLREYVSFFVD